MLQKMKIYEHGLPPLLMQNPCSKFILAIKMLSVDRFSKLLQVLLRQIENIKCKKMKEKKKCVKKQELQRKNKKSMYLYMYIIIFENSLQSDS